MFLQMQHQGKTQNWMKNQKPETRALPQVTD